MITTNQQDYTDFINQYYGMVQDDLRQFLTPDRRDKYESLSTTCQIKLVHQWGEERIRHYQNVKGYSGGMSSMIVPLNMGSSQQLIDIANRFNTKIDFIYGNLSSKSKNAVPVNMNNTPSPEPPTAA